MSRDAVLSAFTQSTEFQGRVNNVIAAGCIPWVKTYYGGGMADYATAMKLTADGGYIVAGHTSSFGAGFYDIWILKLHSSGGVIWQKSYGGGQGDYAYSIQQTADGGYIVAGSTESFGVGKEDAWVLKLDSNGNVGPGYPGTWQKTYGGSQYDNAISIQQTADGGYIVAGSTYSFGVGDSDFWVLKLNSMGGVVWQKTYGVGVYENYARSIQQTADGGFILAGDGAGEIWILKLDSNGNVGPTYPGTWQKTYGGSYSSEVRSIQQTPDGSYIIAGATYFPSGVGIWDAWILKLDSNGNVGPTYPGTWQKTYGGIDIDVLHSIQRTADGGYIVAGSTSSFGAGASDAWVFKINSIGNVVWQKAYGASSADDVYSIQQTADGGYIVAGSTYSFGGIGAWVLKLDVSSGIGGCYIQGISTLITKDTADTGLDTNITGVTSTGSENPTSITSQNTSVVPGIVCE
jgi:uncharacterized delta-60 repeat protein